MLMLVSLVSIAVFVFAEGLAERPPAGPGGLMRIQNALLVLHTADAGQFQTGISRTSVLSVGRTVAELCEDAALLHVRDSPLNIENSLKQRIRSWLSLALGRVRGYHFEVALSDNTWSFEISEGEELGTLSEREIRFPSLRFPSVELVMRLQVWS
jgi:hypothetical protein